MKDKEHSILNTEVIWERSEGGDGHLYPIGMIVDGERLIMDEYHKKYPLILKGEMK